MHAALPPGDDGLQRLIRMPEQLADGLYRIRCDAMILSAGGVRDLACHGQQSAASIRLQQAIVEAAEQAAFQPARMNGEPVEVSMTFSVLVRIEAGKALVGVFPNDGEHWTTLDMNYVSPQRLSGSFGRTSLATSKEGVGAASAALRLRIDEKGTVTSVDVDVQQGELSRREIAALRQKTEKMVFAPGLHNGKPVAMDYVLLYERQQETNQGIRSSGMSM